MQPDIRFSRRTAESGRLQLTANRSGIRVSMTLEDETVADTCGEEIAAVMTDAIEQLSQVRGE
jgi:hypothetical protein